MDFNTSSNGSESTKGETSCGISFKTFLRFVNYIDLVVLQTIHAAGNGIADGNEIRPLPIADGNGQTAIDGNRQCIK